MQQDYCLGFVLNPERTKVVLIDKLRPNWQRGKLNGTGGKLEPGEDPVVGMQRECFEETGLRIPASGWRLIAHRDFPRTRIHCFAATIFEIHAARTETDELVRVLPLDSLSAWDLVENTHLLVLLAAAKLNPVTLTDFTP